jgi:UrcA family protein
MKTLTKTLAVGLVAMIGAFVAAPASQAETGAAPAGYKRVSVAFSYNPSAPAAKVYSDLQRKARKACTDNGVRPLALHRVSEECVAEMVESGVAQFGRADIAELHKGRITVASR